MNVFGLRFLALLVGKNLVSQAEVRVHFQRFPRPDSVLIDADKKLCVILSEMRKRKAMNGWVGWLGQVGGVGWLEQVGWVGCLGWV